MHKSESRLAIVGFYFRQWSQCIGSESFIRRLSCLAMYSLVGRFIEPLSYLQIGVVQADERPQWNEVLFYITHARPLDLSLLPGRGDVTGSRVKSILARESEEPLVELHDIAFVFTYRRR